MTDSISNIAVLAGQLAALKTQISDLNAQLKDLKETESQLKAQILLEMGPAKTVNLDGLGRLTRRDTTRYEIRDIELVAQAMLRIMVENARAGRPLSDGLLLQQRTSARNIEDVMDAAGIEGDAEEAYIAKAGLARVSEPVLSFTKS